MVGREMVRWTPKLFAVRLFMFLQTMSIFEYLSMFSAHTYTYTCTHTHTHTRCYTYVLTVEFTTWFWTIWRTRLQLAFSTSAAMDLWRSMTCGRAKCVPSTGFVYSYVRMRYGCAVHGSRIRLPLDGRLTVNDLRLGKAGPDPSGLTHTAWQRLGSKSQEICLSWVTGGMWHKLGLVWWWLPTHSLRAIAYCFGETNMTAVRGDFSNLFMLS